MSEDFSLVYNRLKVKMFYATIAIFAIRYMVLLYLNAKNHDWIYLYINLTGFSIFIIDFVFLLLHNDKVRLATLILIYTNVLNIFILYVLGPNVLSREMYIARDLVIINILVLVTAFMAGRKHAILLTVFLIIIFLSLTFFFKVQIFTPYLFYIIFFLIAACFIFSLLANLIETTVKMTIDAKREVENLSSFKQNIIRLIYHDLKVPVNSIIDLNRNEKIEIAEKTIFYAENIKKHLENVLDVELLEEAEMKLDTKNENINEIIVQALKSVEIIAGQKNIKLFSSFQTNGFLLCDKSLIERVVINLLSNAIKYSPANKTVSVKVYQDKENCIIAVKDEGVGIKSEHLDKIFNKYYKVNSEVSSSNSSNGLGLTFCKLAIKAHKGTIKVRSGENTGSEFIVQLPGFKSAESGLSTETGNTSAELKLSKSDKQKLTPYCKKIKEIPLYKIGEIISIIKPLDNSSEENIQYWAKKLSDAVYIGNKEYFDELIFLITGTEHDRE